MQSHARHALCFFQERKGIKACLARLIPELPWEKRERFQKDYGLNDYDAGFLANQASIANYFEAALKAAGNTPAKNAANWVAGEVSATLNKTEKTSKNVQSALKILVRY